MTCTAGAGAGREGLVQDMHRGCTGGARGLYPAFTGGRRAQRAGAVRARRGRAGVLRAGAEQAVGKIWTTGMMTRGCGKRGR